MPSRLRETKAQRLRQSQICQTQSTAWRDAEDKFACDARGIPEFDSSTIETGSLSEALLNASHSRLESTELSCRSGITGGSSGAASQQHAEERSRFGFEQHDVDSAQHDFDSASEFWQHDFVGDSDFVEQQFPHELAPASSDCVSSDAAVMARINVWKRREFTSSSHRQKRTAAIMPGKSDDREVSLWPICEAAWIPREANE